MKKDYKGDGLAFYRATKTSGINNEDLQKDMDISNGTFYRLFKQEIIDDETKAAAAKALGRAVEDIFGTNDLHKARQDWFSRKMQEHEIDEIADKTGYADEDVSLYLSNKRTMPLDFMKSFCDAYGMDFDSANSIVFESLRKTIVSQQLKNKGAKQKNIDETFTNYNSIDNQKDVPTGTLNNENDSLGLEDKTPNVMMIDKFLALYHKQADTANKQADALKGMTESFNRLTRLYEEATRENKTEGAVMTVKQTED